MLLHFTTQNFTILFIFTDILEEGDNSDIN